MQRGMHRAQYQSYLDQDRGEGRMEPADKDVSKLLISDSDESSSDDESATTTRRKIAEKGVFNSICKNSINQETQYSSVESLYNEWMNVDKWTEYRSNMVLFGGRWYRDDSNDHGWNTGEY
ncbi:hypothetical protein COOONC_12809 [Cooperia oncophora]